MSEWRPISTAPKDGNEILAAGPGWESEQRIKYVEWPDNEHDPDLTLDPGYWEFCETVLASVEPEADPSHWMFPPNRPEPESG